MNTNKKIKFLIKESDNSLADFLKAGYAYGTYGDQLGPNVGGKAASELMQSVGKTTEKLSLDINDLHVVLDLIGLIEIPIGPVTIGMVADFTNSLWYLAEGNIFAAGISFIAAIFPVIGDFIKLYGLSGAVKNIPEGAVREVAEKILKTLDEVLKICKKLKEKPKYTKKAEDLIVEIEKIREALINNPKEGVTAFAEFVKNNYKYLKEKPGRINRAISAVEVLLKSQTNIDTRVFLRAFRPHHYTKKMFFFQFCFWYFINFTQQGNEFIKNILSMGIDGFRFLKTYIIDGKDAANILPPIFKEDYAKFVSEATDYLLNKAKIPPKQDCSAGEILINLENSPLVNKFPHGLCMNQDNKITGYLTRKQSSSLDSVMRQREEADRMLKQNLDSILKSLKAPESNIPQDDQPLPPPEQSKARQENIKKRLAALLEYVPQTGRGFSDGNEYVGKKTKGPYEYVAEEDTPWYKKKYKEDSKNLKILIGHGSKTPKYAKKGGPFTQNPPKRRPVNKLSAPPMALDEVVLPQTFKDAFLKLTNAQVEFKPIQDINTTILFKDVLVFKQGQTYQGIISGNDILLKATEQGDKTLTKQEFLQKLEQAKGELCQSVDCKASKIKSGNNILTFDEFMQSASQPQQAEEPREKGYTELEKARMAQNTTLAGNIAANVANGVDIKQAINNEIGYHPIAQSFSNKFYEIMTKALENIKDPDEKKAAALLTVLFGNITMIPIDAAARVYGEIPQDAIKSAMDAVSKIYAPIAEKIQELQEMWKKIEEKLNVGNIIDKVKEKAQDITKIGTDLIRDYEITDLKRAKQNKNEAIILGDQQKTTLYRGFNSIISAKGYQASRTFDFPANSNFGDVEKNSSFERFITDNKDKIGLFFISFGSSDRIAQINTVEAVKLIKFLKQRVPDVEIIWVGSPPLQKAQPDFSKKNDSLKSNNEAIAMAKAIPLLNFIFVDPFKYLGSDEPSGIYTDGVNLSDNGAKKVLSGALSGGKQNITADSNDLNNINDFIISRQDISALSDDFKFELIKLSKRAKETFGTAAKINVISGKQGREETTNHGTGKAADIRINDGKKDLTAQQTYALLITSVLDGIIKDGGIGYYANTVGTYDPEKMDVTQEYPHYDILGVRKWFWFKCEPDKNKCEQRVNSRYFKEGQKSGPNEYQTSAALSAAEVADEDNPLKLPEDVFKLIGQYRRSKTKTAETSVADLFKEDFLNSLSSEQKNNMSIIDNVFTDAGYSKNVIAAAIVNSFAESGMISSTVGISGSPVGLFQIIRTSSGLDPKIYNKTRDDFVKMAQSKGLDPKSSSTHSILRRKYKNEWDSYVQNRLDDGDYRFDPEKNAKKIVSWTSRMKHVKDADEKDKKSIPELTAIFTEKVEVAGNDVTPLKRKERAEGFLKIKRA